MVIEEGNSYNKSILIILWEIIPDQLISLNYLYATEF